MIVTKHLLSDFVDISHLSLEKLCVGLNTIGLEVESVVVFEIPQKVVVGKVVSKSYHPNADKLSVCEVDVGSEVLQIVCGAKNVDAEQFVAVALEGATIPASNKESKPLTIKKTTLRGVESCGMICSSVELGLPKINDGIMVLDSSVGKFSIGQQLCDLEFFNNYAIEVSITPNRGDCLSVLGIARDISAYFDLRLKIINDIDNILSLGLGRVLGVNVENKLYSHLLYRVAQINSFSLPLSVALVLGFNDTLKDDVVQSFLEYGRYLSGVIFNAYKLDECRLRDSDEDSLEAQLYVKKDKNGVETICTKDKILSQVGIFHNDTKFDCKNEIIVIEASYAPPKIIAEAIYNHKLKTTPHIAYRSTRGSNPDLEQGMNILCRAMLQDSKTLVYSGTHNIDQYDQENKIKTTFDSITHIIGNVLDKEEMSSILKRLKFELEVTGSESFFIASVPPYRHDISSTQDLAEEILRIYGIDNITPKPCAFSEQLQLTLPYARYTYRRNVAKSLLAHGLYECVHYVFASLAHLDSLGFVCVENELDLQNPISSEMDTLRTSLIPTMIESTRHNKNLGFKNIGFFEIGSVYNAKREESTRLCVLLNGALSQECYPNIKPKKWDIFSVANIICSAVGEFSLQNALQTPLKDKLFNKFGFKSDGEFPHILHPYQCAFIFQNDECIGFVGKLHPSLEIEDCFVCEVLLDEQYAKIPHFKDFSKYQKSQRDLTLLLSDDIPFHKIRTAVLLAQIPHLQNIYPVDVYAQSKGVIALSIRLVLQSMQKTLEEKDLVDSTNAVLALLEQKFDAKLKT